VIWRSNLVNGVFATEIGTPVNATNGWMEWLGTDQRPLITVTATNWTIALAYECYDTSAYRGLIGLWNHPDNAHLMAAYAGSVYTRGFTNSVTLWDAAIRPQYGSGTVVYAALSYDRATTNLYAMVATGTPRVVTGWYTSSTAKPYYQGSVNFEMGVEKLSYFFKGRTADIRMYKVAMASNELTTLLGNIPIPP
jgi:hypothetical protein